MGVSSQRPKWGNRSRSTSLPLPCLHLAHLPCSAPFALTVCKAYCPLALRSPQSAVISFAPPVFLLHSKLTVAAPPAGKGRDCPMPSGSSFELSNCVLESFMLNIAPCETYLERKNTVKTTLGELEKAKKLKV